MTLLFVMSLAFLYRIVVRRVSVISFFRFIAIAFSIFLFLSFWLGLAHLPINLATWTVTTLVLAVVAWLGKIRLNRNETKEKATLRGNRDREYPVCLARRLLVLGTIAGVVIGSVYFSSDFSVPQFVSIDPALHFVFARKIVEDDEIQYFSRSIFFPDSENVHTYPYGTAVVTGLFMSSAPHVDPFTVFQIVAVLFYALVNGYGLYVLQKLFRLRTNLSLFVVFLLITLGFFLNLLIIGFSSQLLGLFFLFACIDVYVSFSHSWKKDVLLSLLLAAVTMTYFNYVAYLLLFWAAEFASVTVVKGLRSSFVLLKRWTRVGFLFLVASSPYLYMIVTSTLIGVITTARGLTYEVFLGNIFILLPLVMVSVWVSVRQLRDRVSVGNTGFLFLISSVGYLGVLGVLFAAGIFEAYIFAKSFYLTIPVIYFAAMKGLDLLGTQKEKMFRVLNVSYALMIVYVVLFPFFAPVSSYTLASSLQRRFDDLNVRPLDIFFYNGQSFVNPAIHSYNFDSSEVHFSREVGRILKDELSEKRVSVIADGNRRLWFYAFSDIWPRDIEGELSLWTPEMIDLGVWKEKRGSDYLVVFDNGYTREWMENNDFDYSLFDVVYSHGGHYLLRNRVASLYSQD